MPTESFVAVRRLEAPHLSTASIFPFHPIRSSLARETVEMVRGGQSDGGLGYVWRGIYQQAVARRMNFHRHGPLRGGNLI